MSPRDAVNTQEGQSHIATGHVTLCARGAGDGEGHGRGEDGRHYSRGAWLQHYLINGNGQQVNIVEDIGEREDYKRKRHYQDGKRNEERRREEDGGTEENKSSKRSEFNLGDYFRNVGEEQRNQTEDIGERENYSRKQHYQQKHKQDFMEKQ